MYSNELLYALALSYTKGLGNINTKKLIQHFGSAAQVWGLPKSKLLQIKGLPKKVLENFANDDLLKLADAEIEKSIKLNIKISYFLDTNYPSRLKECLDSPCILFTKGNLNLEHGKFVSVVGTRKMTTYGKQFINHLISELKGYDITIISGLALGCDIAAHRAALDSQLPTIAVLAHGLNHVYPKSNQSEATKMQQKGGLVSEFSSFHQPEAVNFLRRNRIIAGLSDLVVVVESNYKGGAMSTAASANNYNREVMALPGRITDPLSNGCNHLIATNQALMLRNANDLLYHLNIKNKPKSVQKELFLDLNEQEQKIYDHLLKNGKQQIDELAYYLNMPSYQLMPILLNLELKNIVKPLPGKVFEIL